MNAIWNLVDCIDQTINMPTFPRERKLVPTHTILKWLEKKAFAFFFSLLPLQEGENIMDHFLCLGG